MSKCTNCNDNKKITIDSKHNNKLNDPIIDELIYNHFVNTNKININDNLNLCSNCYMIYQINIIFSYDYYNKYLIEGTIKSSSISSSNSIHTSI